MLHFWSAQHGSHSFLYCKYTMPPLPRSSPRGATTEWTVIAPADEDYYSFIDPVRMKAELVLLADLQRTEFTNINGIPISCRSGVDQWKFAGQRLTFYHWATQPTSVHCQCCGCTVDARGVHSFVCKTAHGRIWTRHQVLNDLIQVGPISSVVVIAVAVVTVITEMYLAIFLLFRKVEAGMV